MRPDENVRRMRQADVGCPIRLTALDGTRLTPMGIKVAFEDFRKASNLGVFD